MTAPTSGAPGTPILPDYGPFRGPRSARPLTTSDTTSDVWAEPVLGHQRRLPLRVPGHPGRRGAIRRAPTIGHNLHRAVNEVAAAEGVTNTVTHLVYTHHHSDHAGASSLFGTNVVAARTERPF